MAFPEAARLLNQAGYYLRKRARYQEAEPLCRRALAICESALGANHPYTATSLNNLAELYHAQGRYAEAEPLSRRALAINESAWAQDHPRDGHGPEQPGGALRRPGSLRRGRAALPPGAGDQ